MEIFVNGKIFPLLSSPARCSKFTIIFSFLFSTTLGMKPKEKDSFILFWTSHHIQNLNSFWLGLSNLYAPNKISLPYYPRLSQLIYSATLTREVSAEQPVFRGIGNGWSNRIKSGEENV
jgi:hypothetical protein